MPKENLEHLIYAPVPHKGYSIRAKSPGTNENEFIGSVKDWMVPFDQHLFKPTFECRMISSTPANTLFLSRFFEKSKNLDELKRGGVVWHITAIPEELLKRGISLKAVDQSLIQYEQNNGVSLGEMKSLEVSPETTTKDTDLSKMQKLIPEESSRKILNAFEKDNAKVLVICKGNIWDRIELFLILSKFLVKCGIKNFSSTSEFPKEIILKVSKNVLVISGYLPSIKPGSGWTIINLSKKESETGINKEITEKTLEDIYKT